MSKATPNVRFRGFFDKWRKTLIDEIMSIRKEIGNQNDYSLDVELENLVSNMGILIGDVSVRTQSNSIFRKGDILFGRLRPYLNKWWLSDTEGVKSGEIWALYPKKENSNTFLYSLVQTNKFLSAANTSSGTKMPRSDWNNLSNLVVDLPLIEEQKKIGTFFKQLDDTISFLEQLVQQQQQYKKVMLEKMFPQEGEYVPKIRFVEFSGEWKEAKIGDIYSFKNGLNKEKEAFGTGTPIVNYMDVNKNVVVHNKDIQGRVELTDSEKHRFHVQPNDIFFTRTSETSDEIGLTCAYTGEEIDLVFSGFILKATPINNQVDSVFHAYYLRSSSKRKEIVKHSSITTRALTSGTLLSQISIKVPSIQEQQKIGTFFKQLDDTIVLHQKKIADYRQMKKALLQRMFV